MQPCYYRRQGGFYVITSVCPFCRILSSFSEQVKACPHCRRKVRQFLAENSDCRRKMRQSPNFAVVSPFLATVSFFCDSVDRALVVDGFNKMLEGTKRVH